MTLQTAGDLGTFPSLLEGTGVLFVLPLRKVLIDVAYGGGECPGKGNAIASRVMRSIDHGFWYAPRRRSR